MNRVQYLQAQIDDLKKAIKNNGNRIERLETPPQFEVGNKVIVGYKAWCAFGYSEPDFKSKDAYNGVIIKRTYEDGGWHYELWVKKDKVIATAYEETMKLKT